MSSRDGEQTEGVPRPGAMQHAGASLYEQLRRTITKHAEAEAASIKEYERLANSSQDPLVQMLMRLLLQDELRHHDLFLRMAVTLGRGAYQHPDDLLPLTPEPEWRPTLAEMGSVRRLLRDELESVRFLQDLAEAQRPLFSGVFSDLLDLMAMDSGKHERILAVVLRRMEDQRRITTAFQAERQEIRDVLARSCQGNGAVDKEGLECAIAMVRRQMYAEEERLYPSLEQERFASTIEQACYNHGRVCDLVDAIEEAVRSGARPQQVREKVQDLIAVLEGHDRLEQFVLYPAIEDALNRGDLVRLFGEMETATPPPGWVCRERTRSH